MNKQQNPIEVREKIDTFIDENSNENEAEQPAELPKEPAGSIQKIDLLKEYGQIVLPERSKKNPRGTIHYLNIIGQIEGHMVMPPNNKTTKYEHVIPQLVAVAENPDIDGLLVILNTVGGDVEAGLAIAELISQIGKPTVSLVLGGGHSIGVPLAVAARYSYIAPSATMTVHPVRMSGTVIGAPQTFDYFNKMQERISEFILRNSGIKRERLRALMLDTEKLMLDVGSILIGEEAVNEKLIDQVGGINDAMEMLYIMIDEERKKKKAAVKKHPHAVQKDKKKKA
ncbi:MAG: ATP-dependent Clp protease proteolytic subunit [Clostridiales bacterium]|jgi:ATP-dependent protease ClpP protease subunit|nr:ATP-dependent Clp protease proteolytic subunit [Clostridiales bacterium]